jgi:hypothetical protein
LVVRPAQDRLIASLEALAPRKGFRTAPKRTLAEVAARWRALPAETRLALKLKQHGEKLSLAEVRVIPSRMKMETWDGTELVLGLMLSQIDCGRELAISRRPLGDASLHAVARRFERGADRSDAAVLSDLWALAEAFPERALVGGDFRVPAGEGFWVGERVEYHGGPHLAARTFVAT